MIIESLNKIRNYVLRPESIPIDYAYVFSNEIFEEYFWKKASDHNQLQIFNKVLHFDSDYFINKFKKIIEEKQWTQADYWSVLFIRKLSISIYNNSEDFTSLISLVDEFIDVVYRNEAPEQQSLWFIADTIIYFPLESITDNYLKFISEKTLVNHPSMVANSIEEKLVPRIIEEKNVRLAKSLIKDVLFAYDKEQGNESDYRFGGGIRFDSYILSRIIDKENIRSFKELIGAEKLAEIIINILVDLSNKDYFGFSSLGLPSIEDTNQIWDKYAFTYLAMKFLRDFVEIENPDAEFVKDKLLSSNTKVIKRIGIHTVNFYYNDLKNIFWELENPLSDNELKHEIFYLLEKNANTISSDQLNQLEGWIDKIKVEKWGEDQTDEDLNRSRALIGKEFLAALSDIDESLRDQVKKKKLELDSIHPYDREHPGFNSYSTSTIGHDYPDTYDAYKSNTKTLDDLVTYFSKEDKWSEPEKEGQGSLLQETFSNRPDFIENTKKLFELNIRYFESVIYGLQKAFETGKSIDWKSFFEIVNKILESKIDEDYRKNLVGYISWLLREALKDDKNERGIFNKDIEIAKDILLQFLKLDYRSKRLNKDPQLDILNSTEGKVLDATVSLLLRNARLNKKEQEDKWLPEIKEHYTTIIQSKGCTDAYINNITKFLPQFGYLDKSWVENNIDFIFPRTDIKLWKLAMTTYTRMTNSVYKDIFDILLHHGHYDFGISVMKGDDEGVDGFVEQIVVAYIAGWEGQQLTNKESLINKLLNNGDTKQIIHIITSIFRYRGEISEKVLPLWKAILVSKFEKNSEQMILKELLKLINKIDLIDDESYDIIKANMDRIEVKDDLYVPIRYLTNSESEDIEKRMNLLMIGTSDNLEEHHMQNIFAEMAEKVYPTNPKLTNAFLENLVSKRVFSLIDVYNKLHEVN